MIRAFSFSFSYSYLWHFPLPLRCVPGVSGVLRAFPFPSSSSGCCMLLMLIHTTYILSIIFSKRALLVGPWFFSLFSVIWIRECDDAETLRFLASFRSKRGRSSPSPSLAVSPLQTPPPPPPLSLQEANSLSPVSTGDASQRASVK